MTVLEWLLAHRSGVGLTCMFVGVAGAWFGPWVALGVAGLILAWR